MNYINYKAMIIRVPKDLLSIKRAILDLNRSVFIYNIDIQ